MEADRVEIAQGLLAGDRESGFENDRIKIIQKSCTTYTLCFIFEIDKFMLIRVNSNLSSNILCACELAFLLVSYVSSRMRCVTREVNVSFVGTRK